jgi:Protein of unknown function (DUF1517)
MVMLATTSIFLLCVSRALAWQTSSLPRNGWTSPSLSKTRLHLFDRIFEEEGILGKGITVGKIQVALNSPTRGPDSIFGILEKEANDDKSLPELTNAICLALLRKKDFWIGSYGTSQWFGQNDAGKAESKFNEFANKEAAKFEKVGSNDEIEKSTEVHNPENSG